ncbi:MAG: histidine triad nucleotide-binding protein [candidate division WOR-3 bacterium]|nr:histidine triad nucleotide-binding protein [candidate division WOR-3 bacterium]
MNDCLFCKIISGDIDSDKVYEDQYVYAFNDINPQAPVHILIIPKKHIESIHDVSGSDKPYIDAVISAIQKIASDNGLDRDGYRIVTNHGKRAGQSVFHLHFHLLGGRDLQWPPG